MVLDKTWWFCASWLPWLANAAQANALSLCGARWEGGEWWVSTLAESCEGATEASVHQRPGCAGVQTQLRLWSGDILLGAWVLRSSSNREAERAWQLLLLEALVLDSRPTRVLSPDRLAAK